MKKEFSSTGANRENGEWKNGILQGWKTGRLEYWKIGKSEHHSIIPCFHFSLFHYSIIPPFQHPNALCFLCDLLLTFILEGVLWATLQIQSLLRVTRRIRTWSGFPVALS